MANRVWKGGVGDFYNMANWMTTTSDPADFPLPGDTFTVSNGTVDLIGSEAEDTGSFNDVTATIGTAGGAVAELDVIDAVIGNDFSVTAAGSVELLSTGLSDFNGLINAAVSGATLILGSQANGNQAGNLVFGYGSSVNVSNGEALELVGTITIEAAAGFIVPATDVVVNDATVNTIGVANTIDGNLTGTGTFNLEFSTTLFAGGSVSSGQTIYFGGLDGRLKLAKPTAFAGAIANFQPGDLIDLTTVSASSVSYNASAGTLTLSNGTGTAPVATLSRVQAAAGTLVATSDGSGGTLVSYANTETREQYEIAGAADALGANVVHTTMTVPGTTTPITGAGIKIGIISTSFDEVMPGSANLDAQAGYLPETADGQSAVTVLTEGPAGSDDEGRAMAELIYQTAPGAQLYFASGSSSATAFASAVAQLQAAGCNVIVDDLSFLSAPFYQVDGTVDAAISNAVASGVDYFTSASNFGDAYYEHSFAARTSTLYDGTTANAHIFSNGTPYVDIGVAAGTGTSTIDLQWSAPYEGVGNTGAPDALVMKLFNSSGALVSTSTQQQDVNGTLEADVQLNVPLSATMGVNYFLAVYQNGTAVAPSEFKFILYGENNGTGPGGVIDDPAAGSGSGDTFGQALIPGVNTVGATYYGNSAAFGQTPDFDEYFSSKGPGTLLYDSSGNPLPAPVSAGKVDFVAPDGVNTSVPGFAGFFGTSAAAPSAAAVAALALQANPHLTTSQVTSVLEQSAVSLGLPAVAQGAGLIQAPEAVTLAEGIACYCAGTLILTDQGEVAVEELAIGDRIITADGADLPIRWIGRRSYAGRFLLANPQLHPVRLRTGSLGEGLPRRDLLVSAEHAMLLDGILVPARCLLNGRSIVRERSLRRVDYFHVELAVHHAILAEGTWSETFLDDDSRGLFHNATEFSAMYPDALVADGFYAPRIESGYDLEAILQKLRSIAVQQTTSDGTSEKLEAG